MLTQQDIHLLDELDSSDIANYLVERFSDALIVLLDRDADEGHDGRCHWRGCAFTVIGLAHHAATKIANDQELAEKSGPE